MSSTKESKTKGGVDGANQTINESLVYILAFLIKLAQDVIYKSETKDQTSYRTQKVLTVFFFAETVRCFDLGRFKQLMFHKCK